MSPRTGGVSLTMGGASRVRPGGVSSGGRMKENYGISKRKGRSNSGGGGGSSNSNGNNHSGQRLRDFYGKAGCDASRSSIRNGKGHLYRDIIHTSTNGHTDLTLSHSPFTSSPRKDSVGNESSCSNESDGQLLCTEDRCIMDASSSTKRGTAALSASQTELRLRQTVGKSSSAGSASSKNGNSQTVTTTGKLCKSCRGEMQEARRGEGLQPRDDGRKGGVFFSRTKTLRRSLSDMMPKWLSEPEFMMHAKPRLSKDHIHRNADSLFSTSSGFTNYYGMLNLALILLVLANARLFLENIIKYGILINLSFLKIFLREPYNWPNLLLSLSIPIYPVLALLTEKALVKNWISDRAGFVVYCVNLGTLLLLPAGVIYYLHPFMVFSLVTLGLVTICFLKLASYGHTNYWCRESYRAPRHRRSRSISSGGAANGSPEANGKNTHSSTGLQVYPENLNVKDMAYYMFAPTICYEVNFPRSARIRKRFLLKRLLEMAFLNWMIVALIQQWIVPALNNARQPLAEMEVFKMLERLLKLSIPNHLIWLVFFYSFFHSALNVLAELTKFGDREFYSDWWNAEAVSDFWKDWNIPVHRFCTRHIYKPLLRKGMSKLAASTCVFLVSAFFHEYLVSVPLRMFKAWAFMGMLLQVPIAYVTGKYIKGKWGNIVMWLSLILGQPVAILAYFHDYYITHSLPLMQNATAAGTPGI